MQDPKDVLGLAVKIKDDVLFCGLLYVSLPWRCFSLRERLILGSRWLLRNIHIFFGRRADGLPWPIRHPIYLPIHITDAVFQPAVS